MPEPLFNKAVDLLAWNFKLNTGSRIFMIFFNEFCNNFKNTSRRLPLIFRKLDTVTFNSKRRVQVFLGPDFSGSRFSGSRLFWVQVFQDPGFSGSRFFRVQVFLDPGFLGSGFFRVQVFQGPSPSFRSIHFSNICTL